MRNKKKSIATQLIFCVPVILIMVYIAWLYYDCSESGGRLMRSMLGFLECIV